MKNARNLLALIVTIALAGASAGCGGMDDMTPNPPSDLKAEALEGGAHLTWKDNSDNESAFMIERMLGSEDWKTLTTVPFNTTQYHDPNLTKGTTYVYRVMAMPKEGGHDTSKAKYSNEVTFKTP